MKPHEVQWLLISLPPLKGTVSSNCMSQHIKGANTTRNELPFHAQNALCLRIITFKDTKQEGFVETTNLSPPPKKNPKQQKQPYYECISY